MSDEQEIKRRDLQTLFGIVRGPGSYASPSPDRIRRLIDRGLIRKEGGTLQPTLKGRIVAFLNRRRRGSS